MQSINLSPLLRAAGERGLHIRNIIIRQHGAIVARHDFMPDTPHILFSASKGVTSMAIGIARGEGLLKLGDSIAKYFPEAAIHAGYDEITVENLLTMSTGHAACPIVGKHGITDFEAEFYREPLMYRPGTRFVYNNCATYLLSKIITTVSGLPLADYLMPRLFAPLGIEKPRWDADCFGINHGYSDLYLTAEQLSMIAQVVLDGGKWNGRQLVPQDYVTLATGKRIGTAHITDDWATADSRAGYGYQLWCNSYPGSCRFDGFLGQYAAIIPDQDMVVTYISDEPDNMLGILALTWEFICPVA